MSKKRGKRRISKISIILITFIWLFALALVLILLFNSLKHRNKLKEVKSKITIPKGFYYVGGDIDTGVVISDNQADEFKGTEYKVLNKLKGNQFVWVAVEKAIVNDYKEAVQMVNDEKIPIAVKTENGYVGLKYKFDTYLKKILVNDYIDEYNQEPYIVTSGGIYGDNEEYIEGSTKGLYQETFNKMVESVEKNKGFYISRYEVGNLTNAVKNNGKIVSKAGEEDITYMDWVNLYKVSHKMYDRDDITTEMIWGCQWDATLVWIAQNIDNRKYIFDTRLVGNFSNSKKKTASSSEYGLNNIYDLAGNAYEWTQRGSIYGGKKAYGGYYGTKNFYTLDMTYMYPITYLWNEVGTRVTMYIN